MIIVQKHVHVFIIFSSFETNKNFITVWINICYIDD